MVHADASHFALHASKREVYQQILSASEALFEEQANWVCNLSNAASLLWHGLKAQSGPSGNINWAGFYVLDPSDKEQLILGPFQGKVACQTIKFSQGVCGTAAATGKTQLVANVQEYPGHIACDSETLSEIVVPILKDGRVVGVIDIDCEQLDGFTQEDVACLEGYAQVLSRACAWPA